MSLNKVSQIGQQVTKKVRNAAIGVALISIMQACDNVQGGAYKTNDMSTIKEPEYDDTDINNFEASLPYADQRAQPIPAISEQDSIWIEEQRKAHTIRSLALDEKPSMDTVDYIALHSTETQAGQEEKTIIYLQKIGKIHYLVKRDGTLIQYLPTQSDGLTQINHIGKGSDPVSCAEWNHDPFVTFKTIGIEVSAMPAQKRSDKQYATIRKLLGYLGQKYNLTQKDIFTHTMVAYSPQYGMMRKQDPAYIDWNELGMPPASAQINKDVVSGNIAPNLSCMYEWCRKRKVGSKPGLGMNHEQAIEYLRLHYSGLDNSIVLHKQRNGGSISPTAQRINEDPKTWMTIYEIDQSMKDYTPPVPVHKKKRTSKKARHRHH